MFEPDKITEHYHGPEIVNYDIVPKIIDFINREGYVLRPDGKIAMAFPSRSIESPWIFVRPHPDTNCNLWHKVMFGLLGIFPSDCLRCWKVVVRPRTIKELFLLLEVQENLTDLHCKCGIEVRKYVHAQYGGYFYNQSEEEGLKNLEVVRKLIAENISPDIPVVLKRYCTEFELKFGPSDQIEESMERGYYIHPEDGSHKPIMKRKEMDIWERRVNEIFDITKDPSPQDGFVRQHIFNTWFSFAWDRGDPTVKEFFDGVDLSPASRIYEPSVTYED